MRPKPITIVATIIGGFLLATNPYVAEAARTISGNDIERHTITSKNMADDSIKSRFVQNNNLRSRDIRDGTLLAKDFADGELPSATADGPAVLMGSVKTDGSGCLVGPVSGIATTAACNQGATGYLAVEMPVPTAKHVRNVSVKTSSPVASASTFFLVGENSDLVSCSVAVGESTCTIAGSFAVPAGGTLVVEWNGDPVDVSYGMELWNPTEAGPPLAPQAKAPRLLSAR